uniref:Uncharacterized protein n=1 Tax=Anguilla anguilla TaxID=7936 RepID=A0A0E9UCS3_ANGAN
MFFGPFLERFPRRRKRRINMFSLPV